MRKRRFFLIPIAIILIFSMSLTAHAGSSTSDSKYATVKGYTYEYRSSVANNSPGQIFYQTSILADEDSSPEGYIGANARVYSSSGVLKASTGWSYTTRDDPVYYEADVYYTASGYYYSKGQVKFYNGSGYNTYTCNATANLTPTKPSLLNSQKSQVNVNNSGERYGSQLFAEEQGVELDLILAEGTNGEIGYIRAEDIRGADVNTVEEALAYEQGRTSYTVPLYREDGATVIGEFNFG